MKQINFFLKSKGQQLQLLLVMIMCSGNLFAQPLAFPTADGHGKYTVGGRGGKVIEVTNLNDDGLPGSLRYAINYSGPRTVVFRVSGTIELNSSINITKGDLTIAGQTAPGDGICVRNYKFNISASNVIIRYMRFRLGDSKVWGDDAFGGYSPKNSAKTSNTLPVKNIIIDHCSVSYGSDETLSIYDIENLTVQWCLISESLNKDGHGFGGIMGGWGASLHHTLFAHHKSRSPRFCGARYQFNLKRELVDMRYNVIYNAGHTYGGEGGRHNVVTNYYKRGESDFCNPSQPNPSETDNEFVGCIYDSIKSYWYVSGNYVYGNSTQTADNWSGGGVKLNYPQLNLRKQTPFPSAYNGPIESVEEAFAKVCNQAGATLPKRDAVDLRVVNDVINNTGKLPLTMADIPGDAFPVLNSLPAPDDTDHDGMPDQWETDNGLNPTDQNDGNAFTLSPGKSYTNLEVYLNSIAGESSAIPVTGVSISPETLITYVDASTQLAAIVKPLNADNKDVTWSSTDTSVVKVNSMGLITCVNAGTATIMVSTEDGGKTATLEITVKPVNVHVSEITVNPDTASVFIDSTLQLNETVLPSDADNKNVKWSSVNTTIATVSTTGLVTGVALGTTTVTVTSQDGGKIASSEITVAPVKVSGVKVDPSQTTISLGASKQLTANVFPVNATNKNVTWSSSDTSVVLVSATGRVSSITEGSATITVTTEDGSKTDSCIVTVVFSAIPIQLINLGFNENTGNTVTNAGSVTTVFTKSTPPSWSTNVFVNGGVSSVDFGTTAGDYYVESGSVINELAGLNSFTITGWVNCRNSTVGSGGNRIVSWINNGAHGVDVVYMSDGSLKVGINQWPDKTIAISSAGKITTNEKGSVSNWKFFAITYESSVSTLQFYFGDNFNKASLDKSITYPQGDVGTAIGKLAIGHFNSESSRNTRTDRIFRGLIDQIEVYNSVLPLLDIQTIQNISSIISVAGIAVTPVTNSINVGAEVQLNATITPTNAYNKSVTWNSDNTSIATVSSTGLVKGISAGTATITATAEDGGKTASCIVEVKSTTSSEKYDLYDPSGINIYPNPTSDMLTIEFSKEFPENKTISLLDVTGKTLKVVQSNALINKLDISDLPAGIYMVKISGSIFNVMKRITKK